MNAEDFIRNNPFPPNGTQLNLQLVKDIQDPSLADQKQQNVEKLFKINARLIWRVYVQHNYGESLDSVMSFMFEGIKRASEIYDASHGMPFYNYAIKITRAMLQNYHNYHSQVIHVPIKKRSNENFEFAYSDINDYMDFETGASPALIEEQEQEDDDLTELYELAEKYGQRTDITEDTKKALALLMAMRGSTIKEICDKFQMSEPKLKKLLSQIIGKLRNYRDHAV